MTIATGTPLLPLLYPCFRGNAYTEPLGVAPWKIEQRRSSPALDSRTHEPIRLTTTYDATLVALSHDARRLVALGATGDGDTIRYLQFDLAYGVGRSFLEAPVAKHRFRNTGRYKVAWSPDGESVAVTEVTLDGKKRCGVAVVGAGTGQVQCIADWRPSSSSARV